MCGLGEIDESVIERIKKVIEMKNNEKVNITKTFNTFWLRSEESELEFRVSRLANVKIIISRVEFTKKRNGTMTNIFLILKQYCEKENIKLITVQSVSSKEMMNWCLKNSFKPDYFNFEHDGVVYGDYNYTVNGQNE